MTRDDAYRIVQRNAQRAWDEQRSFRELLEADPTSPSRLDGERSTSCSTTAVVRHAPAIIDRLDSLEIRADRTAVSGSIAAPARRSRGAGADRSRCRSIRRSRSVLPPRPAKPAATAIRARARPRAHAARVFDHDEVAVSAGVPAGERAPAAWRRRPSRAAPGSRRRLWKRLPRGPNTSPSPRRARSTRSASGGSAAARSVPGPAPPSAGTARSMLRPPHRSPAWSAVAAVDPPRGETMPCEGELQRGHVPAGGAWPDAVRAAERRPAAAAGARCMRGPAAPPSARARCGPGSGSRRRGCPARRHRRSCRRRSDPARQRDLSGRTSAAGGAARRR